MSRIFDAVRSAEKRRGPAADKAAAAADTPDAADAVVAAVKSRVDAPVAAKASEKSASAPSAAATPTQQHAPASPAAQPPAIPESIPAAAIAVIGVTWEDDAAGHNPRRRLAEELKKQLTRVNFRHTDMRQATVYGNAADDTAMLQALRKKYRIHGRFCEFIFLGATSRAACAQFHIKLKILEVIEREAIPERAVILLQEPYFPGV